MYEADGTPGLESTGRASEQWGAVSSVLWRTCPSDMQELYRLLRSTYPVCFSELPCTFQTLPGKQRIMQGPVSPAIARPVLSGRCQSPGAVLQRSPLSRCARCFSTSCVWWRQTSPPLGILLVGAAAGDVSISRCLQDTVNTRFVITEGTQYAQQNHFPNLMETGRSQTNGGAPQRSYAAAGSRPGLNHAVVQVCCAKFSFVSGKGQCTGKTRM
ncbi:hypothetical protein MC885_016957 [Smutsia gigantea]|nr:hypothetical protein MC885_016957 [Smutsia gigantea]